MWHWRLERSIAGDRGGLVQFAFVITGVAAAAGLRWLIDRGENGVEFATFFPVIILAAVFLRWPYALLAAVLSLGMAAALFMNGLSPRPEHSRLAILLISCLTFGLIIAIGQALRRTMREIVRQRALAEDINVELQHRMGNALQIIKALASRAARSDDPRAAFKEFGARIDALSTANRLLGVTSSRKGDLRNLIETTLAPFNLERFDLEGPNLLVGGDLGLMLTMALHELATNAVKYGALSTDGRVRIVWSESGGFVTVDWTESGGPQVEPPTRHGIGSRLLTPHRNLCDVRIAFEPAGVVCHLVFKH
jgi:two-component sensor histidine kinase